MRARIAIVLVATAVMTAGCGGGKGRRQPGETPVEGKLAHVPKPPPAYPAKRNVPLDPQLASTSQHELSTALHSADPIERVHALEAIPQVRVAGSYRQDVLSALDDPESIVRFAAALAAGQMKLTDAHSKLLAMADDHSENVRVAVRYALHRLGDTSLSHQLEKMATDGDPRVRANTAMVLGMLGDPSALKILRTLRVDHTPAVRQQASEAMWRLGDDQGLRDLVGLTFSKFYDDQIVGYLGIALPRNKTVRQHVRDGLAVEDPAKSALEPPLVAARAMGMLDSDEGYGVALLGAASDDFRRRQLAALALGAIGRADAQDVLRKLLADTNADVRLAAAAAILELKAG